MKILITGSKGFIGKVLVAKLRQQKHTITQIDIKSGDDIFDVNRAIAHADIVIHLAALTSVLESYKYKKEYLTTNILGTAHILERCLEFKKKLIFASTPCVEDPLSSPYAESKFVAEQILKTFMPIHPITILRFENVYGPEMKKGSLLYNFYHESKLTVYGNGEQTRDFIHVEDITEIIIAAIDKEWNGRIVEVGSGESVSVNEIAEVFQKLTNKKIVYKPNMPVGLMHSIANTKDLKNLYKKKLKYSMSKFIKDLY